MSKILSIDEMLEAMLVNEMPGAIQFKERLEELGTEIALVLSHKLNIKIKGAIAFEGADLHGVCAAFEPSFKGQPCPPEIEDYDPDEPWSEDK